MPGSWSSLSSPSRQWLRLRRLLVGMVPVYPSRGWLRFARRLWHCSLCSIRWLIGDCAGPVPIETTALNVALRALLAGHYPYGATTYLGNPPTPMPGALILALPFFLLGNSALQNLVWVPIFTWWCLHHFESATMAFSCLAIFLIGCPGSIADFVTGGDYLVNALYVAIAMDALVRAQRSGEPWHRYAASVFLSIAISSRPIYAVAAIILAGSIFQTAGISRMTEFLIVLVLVSVALNGPFFLYDPSRFPTSQLLEKVSVFPHFMHATIVLLRPRSGDSLLEFLRADDRRQDVRPYGRHF